MRLLISHHSTKLLLLVLLAACTSMMGGCKKGSMKTFRTVEVEIDSGVADSLGDLPTFRLDLIGLRPENELDRQIRGLNATDYYADPLRIDYLDRAQAVSFSFTRGSEREQVLQEIPWAAWRSLGVRELMIVDELHSALSQDAGQVGPVERRRQIIPLDGKRWKGRDRTLTIRIRQAGLDFHPQPQPPK
jgi:hypothetical protein